MAEPQPADMDDLIDEAIFDAVCDGEGRATTRYLKHHLAKRGLSIVPRDVVVGLLDILRDCEALDELDERVRNARAVLASAKSK